MNVIPYTITSHEKVEEEITVMVPTIQKIEVNRLVDTTVYDVTLTQEQVDIIVAVFGHVTNGGPVRKLTNSLYEGLVDHASQDDESKAKNKFPTYFKNELSRSCGTLQAKEMK